MYALVNAKLTGEWSTPVKFPRISIGKNLISDGEIGEVMVTGEDDSGD